MTELLERAFTALGGSPTEREVALVADTLRASSDEGTIAALEAAAFGPAFDELAALACASGASAFVALDLVAGFTAGH